MESRSNRPRILPKTTVERKQGITDYTRPRLSLASTVTKLSNNIKTLRHNSKIHMLSQTTSAECLGGSQATLEVRTTQSKYTLLLTVAKFSALCYELRYHNFRIFHLAGSSILKNIKNFFKNTLLDLQYNTSSQKNFKLGRAKAAHTKYKKTQLPS